MKITKHTTVQEALKQSHNVLEVFKKYKLYCPTCKGSAQDTIEIVAFENNLNLEKFLSELNEALKLPTQKHHK